MENKIFDVAVFGGGVIGTCIFNGLVKSGYNAVLIERGTDVCVGTSKANSAIIHAGFDAKPGTFKARFNVEGNLMFPELCSRLGVSLKKIGAFVIGNNEDAVRELLNRGKLNGVDDLKYLNKSALKKAIPNVSDDVTCGLFAPSSYIVNPFLLTITLAEEGVVNGGKVELNFDTKSITKSDCFEITDGRKTIKAKRLVNACGAGYNDMAKLIGSEKYKLVFKRGEYFVLDHSERDLVKSTIFPLPDAHSKGILITPTVDGNILVGPTSYESDDEPLTTDAGLNEIREKCKRLISNVDLSKNIRNFSGVRTIVGDDFVIERSKKVKDVVNLAGICSPGLSSAPAIAKHVIGLLGLQFNPEVRTKKITPYLILNQLSDKEKTKLIKKNPSYGRIVCKCENISEGEIIDAINRPLRCTTTDGVKRRVRPGMGRCQGGFCLDKVIKILAKENKCAFDDIKKDGQESKWIVTDVKGGYDR